MRVSSPAWLLRTTVTLPSSPPGQVGDFIYYDTVINAIEYLNKQNIPYVLFVSPKLVGQNGYITSAQIIELSDNPLCTIGFHSRDHIYMRGLKKSEFAYEIDCKDFEKKYGIKCNYFAYPYGSTMACSLKNILAIKKSNYKAAFGTIDAKTNKKMVEKHPYYIPRINISERSLNKN